MKPETEAPRNPPPRPPVTVFAAEAPPLPTLVVVGEPLPKSKVDKATVQKIVERVKEL